MPISVSRERFAELVDDALDTVPRELIDAMDNVAIQIRGINFDNPNLLGLYHGIALPNRSQDLSFNPPDTITIYRKPLMAICDTEAELAHQVAVTVVHEIAHHFGIDDDWLHAHGWG